MPDGTITILDENGGTIKNKIYFQKADNGSGWIHKNHSSDVDYGMQIRDVDADSNSAILQVSGDLQQAYLILQKAGDASSSRYELYHAGNKPTAADVGAIASTGSTMTGDLEIEKASLPMVKLHNTKSNSASVISGNENAMYIGTYNVDGDNNNFRTFVIADSTVSPDVKEALRIIDRVDGESTYYRVYGTHNKPTAADVGAIPASGGVLSGSLTVKVSDNGYGLINKNHSDTADYGMQFRDISGTNKIATLIVSAANQKASLSLKPSADVAASTYELYHEGNKPTASEIQPGTFSGKMLADSTASASVTTKQVRNIYAGTTAMTPGTTQLTSGDIYLQYR